MDHDFKEVTHSHDHASWYTEIVCHAPYAIFSVALSLALVTFLSCFALGSSDQQLVVRGAHLLFHSFHFLHIIFAATGTVITFFRFSQNLIRGVLVGIFAPMVFCTLSDVVLPYIGGSILGVHMHFHLCFVSELSNVIPFLFVGIVNGLLMSKYHESKQSLYSVFSHFIHIFISSLAATFYLVSHGFIEWYSQMGIIFLFLTLAVVVPCTLADIVVPMAFARAGKKR